MKKYLVVYDVDSGFAELSNVGVFDADTESEAREIARKQWNNTSARLWAIALDDCESGWSYYT